MQTLVRKVTLFRKNSIGKSNAFNIHRVATVLLDKKKQMQQDNDGGQHLLSIPPSESPSKNASMSIDDTPKKTKFLEAVKQSEEASKIIHKLPLKEEEQEESPTHYHEAS